MKIFDEEEVDDVACQYSKECGNLGFERTDFIAGVEYAESKVEDLCIEFAEWIFTSPLILTDIHGGVGSNLTTKELFEQFLKGRK